MEDVLSSRLRHYRSNSINADIHTFHIRSQAQYEPSLIHRMKENPKLFHAYIRHKKKTGRTSVGPLLPSGELSDSSLGMAESFSQAFSSGYTSHNLSNPALFQYSSTTVTDVDVHVEQVEALLQDLDPFTAAGPDEIHPQILKSCAAVLALRLTTIFNKSLREGKLPNLRKHSVIIPIHKNSGHMCATFATLWSQ